MSVYNINYSDFVDNQLPPDKRGIVTKAYLTALLVTLEEVHIDTFGPYRDDVIKRSKQNGQRILFESVLNETFGVVSAPFIYIDNTGDNITPALFHNISEGLDPVILFNISEAQPPLYLNNVSEVSANRNFIVYVPSAVFATFGADAIEEEVDRLKPYSTNYTIITY